MTVHVEHLKRSAGNGLTGELIDLGYDYYERLIGHIEARRFLSCLAVR